MKPMLPAVAHRLAKRRRGSVICVYEVAALRGVPDAVVVDFATEFAQRPAVTDAIDLAVWLALTRATKPAMTNDPTTTAQVASWVGYTTGYVGSVSLARLRELEFVDSPRRGSWVLRQAYAHRVRTMSTIELKRKDWRQGLRQAALHGRGADHAWLVVDGAAMSEDSQNWTSAASASRMRGVGLARLLGAGQLRTPVAPAPRQARRTDAAELTRAVLAERCWAIVSTGATSGPVFPVFGRTVSRAMG